MTSTNTTGLEHVIFRAPTATYI